MTLACAGIAASDPTAVIVPFSITTVARSTTVPSPTSTRAFSIA